MASEIFTQIALFLAFVVSLATLLEYSSPFLKNGFIDLLEKFQRKQHFDIIESGNGFLNIFDHIYIGKNINNIKYQNLWAWFIITYTTTLIFSIISLLYGENLEIIVAIIIGLFFGTILFIFYFLFIRNLKGNYDISYLLKILLFLLTNVECQNISTKKIKNMDTHPLIKYISVSYIVALSTAISVFLLGLFARLVYPWMVSQDPNYPTTPFFEINIYLYVLILIIMSIYLFIPEFYGSLFFILIYSFINKYKHFFIISPIRSILSSLIAIISITAFIFLFVDNDIIYYIVEDFHQLGWIIFFYLFLNIFADSFSMLETYFVLKFASYGKPERFPILLFIDFLASGILFLTIPIITGNFNIFYDAIFLKGEIPWLGILFWSTFLTSIFFYLYIFSIGVLLVFYNYSKIDEKYLNIKKHPFFSIALILFLLYFILKILNMFIPLSYLFLIIIFIIIILSLKLYNIGE